MGLVMKAMTKTSLALAAAIATLVVLRRGEGRGVVAIVWSIGGVVVVFVVV